MGATASFPQTLDKKAVKAGMGKEFDEAYFDHNAAEDGTITKDQLLAYYMQREKLRIAFDQIDTDRSGFIDKEEMGKLFEALDLSTDKLDEIMLTMDKDGDNKVSFREFAGSVNLGGKRMLEKAITMAMGQGGRLTGVLTLQQQFDKRKAEAKAETDPEKKKMLEEKLTALSAKLQSVALSEEKRLFRAFREMDTDNSGSLDKDELMGALKALDLGVAKVDGIFEAMGGVDGAGITFAQFKNAIQLGGGKSFEKALTAKIMHNFKDGELVDFAKLEEQFEKRKQQVKELKAKLALTPGDAAIEAELKKSMAQGEAVASKMKAVAAQENRELKNLFCQIDTDGSGTISADELDEALKASGTVLSSLKPSVLRAAIEKAPEKQMDYAAWKVAIKAAGGPTWLRMLRANVDASGHLKGLLTLDELYQQKKEQCKALKVVISQSEGDAQAKAQADLKAKQSQLEALSAKLKAKAISDEKKLLRAFKAIDTDDSGALGRVELEAALQSLQLDLCDVGALFKALGGEEGEGVTFDKFKEAVKIGGGKSFEKALTATVMHDGEVASWEKIEQTYAKRKQQCKEAEEKLAASPDDAELQAALKKRQTQCEAIAAKGKAFAAEENKKLKDLFVAVDTDGSGKIDGAEIKAAVDGMNLESVDGAKLIAAVEAAGGQMDFEGWKAAIKDAGGKSFAKAMDRYVGVDGKMLFASA